MLEKYRDKVRLVFKNFPLKNHPQARPAAEAAMAANRQGKFWPFHDRIFADKKVLTPEGLEGIAKDLGLDMKRWATDRSGPEVAALIERDIREASFNGVRGTPTVFINEEPLRSRSLEGFSAQIDEELSRNHPKGPDR